MSGKTKKTAKQAAPALDPETMPDDEPEFFVKLSYAEYNRRRKAAQAAKQQRIDELYEELADLGIEFEDEDDETDDVPRLPEGPEPPHAKQDTEPEHENLSLTGVPMKQLIPQAWMLYGQLVGRGFIPAPDLDLNGGDAYKKAGFDLHQEIIQLTIVLEFIEW